MTHPLAVIIGSDQTRTLATSALPDAPSLPGPVRNAPKAGRRARARARAAGVLRRAACRIEPAAA